MNLKTFFTAAVAALSMASCMTRETTAEKQMNAERLGQGQAAADYFKAQYDSAMVSDSGRVFSVQRAIPKINWSIGEKFNTARVSVSGHITSDTSGVKLVVNAIDYWGSRSKFVDGKLITDGKLK